MYEIEKSIHMVNTLMTVCKSFEQSLAKQTILNFNLDNPPKAAILLSDPKWRNLSTDVNRLFENTPILEAYHDRWNSILHQIMTGGGIMDPNVKDMNVLFHDMLGCLEDAREVRTSAEKNLVGIKIFISHNSKDKEYCQVLVYFLISIGFKQEDVVCTSVPNCGPQVGDDIYAWLRSQFDGNLHVIYMLSDNYYKSVPSVAELGAAWVTQKDYTSVILPDFSMAKAEGPIDKNKMGVDLNLDDSGLRAQLKQFAKNIGVTVSDSQIDLAADQFIKSIKKEQNGIPWVTF